MAPVVAAVAGLAATIEAGAEVGAGAIGAGTLQLGLGLEAEPTPTALPDPFCPRLSETPLLMGGHLGVEPGEVAAPEGAYSQLRADQGGGVTGALHQVSLSLTPILITIMAVRPNLSMLGSLVLRGET